MTAPREVPRAKTPLTLDQFRALVAEIEPGLPTLTLAVLWGQFACETAGGVSIWNHNFGNLRWFDGCTWDWTVLRTWERENGVNVPQDGRFRAYPSAQDGCRDWLAKLQVRWPSAWKAAIEGDVPAFVHALAVGGYFTAPEADYRRQVQNHARNFIDRVTTPFPTPTQPETPATPLGWETRAEWDKDHGPD